MGAVIPGRRGEQIVLTQFPPRHIDSVNARLDQIVSESDEEPEDGS